MKSGTIFKLLFPLVAVLLCFSALQAHLVGKAAHERYLYPTVRVTHGSTGGSGTVVYSKVGNKPGCTSTYILTNHHVIAGAVSISEQWDSDLQKNVKKERRSIVYVEIFKYKDLSTPVGTTKLESDIVVYSKDNDIAVLKLRYEGAVEHVALLPKVGQERSYRVMDESIAVGCSLGWPPLISEGVITRLGYQIDSLPYDMSSAQIIFGNSGGGMYTGSGVFVGIPSMVAIVGWSSAVPHMGLFIPAYRIYEWLEKERYDFIYDPSKNEKESLELRDREIEERKKRAMN